MGQRSSIGRYRIISRLGAGGMAEVYLAEDTRLQRKVALKILSAELTQNPDRVRRFRQEARAASALNHPNILTIYDIGEDDSLHFIATEFVDGVTLRKHLVNVGANGGLPMCEVVAIGAQIAGVQPRHRSL